MKRKSFDKFYLVFFTWFKTQFTYPSNRLFPLKPKAHVQLKELTPSLHVPPFKQGREEHSLISTMGKFEKLLEKTTDFRNTHTQERSLTWCNRKPTVNEQGIFLYNMNCVFIITQIIRLCPIMILTDLKFMFNREGHGMIKLFFLTLVVYVNKYKIEFRNLNWIRKKIDFSKKKYT